MKNYDFKYNSFDFTSAATTKILFYRTTLNLVDILKLSSLARQHMAGIFENKSYNLSKTLSELLLHLDL